MGEDLTRINTVDVSNVSMVRGTFLWFRLNATALATLILGFVGSILVGYIRIKSAPVFLFTLGACGAILIGLVAVVGTHVRSELRLVREEGHRPVAIVWWHGTDGGLEQLGFRGTEKASDLQRTLVIYRDSVDGGLHVRVKNVRSYRTLHATFCSVDVMRVFGQRTVTATLTIGGVTIGPMPAAAFLAFDQ